MDEKRLMPHFFITTKDIKQDVITISDKENVHHIARVMRVRVGETLLLVDENSTQYSVVVENIDSKSIKTKITDVSKSAHSLGLRLILAQCVLKTDAQNLVIQKATELGVKGIFPVISDNCVIKESVADAKIQKWQKIANEAVKQCERTDFPVVEKRVTLEKILADTSFDIKIACVERNQSLTLKACLKSLENIQDKKIMVIIGPEGGFSAREIALLNDCDDVYKVGLGKLILRAETAVVSALSNVIYELEQYDL